MNDTLYEVKQTTRFKRDYKLARKRGQDLALTGDWAGFRECHITPDWLLVYKVEEDILVLTLTRIGSHSDLNF